MKAATTPNAIAATIPDIIGPMASPRCQLRHTTLDTSLRSGSGNRPRHLNPCESGRFLSAPELTSLRLRVLPDCLLEVTRDDRASLRYRRVVARRKLKSPWADVAWLPHAVLPAVPSADTWTSLGADREDTLFYVGPSVLTLHTSETAHYRDNLASGRPSLWVSLRLLSGDACGICRVTADPYEGEALTEGIGGTVEAVPMPTEIQAKVAAFVEAFHIERPFIKRERNGADLGAPGRRRLAVGNPHGEDE
jgi:hypothetical protein